MFPSHDPAGVDFQIQSQFSLKNRDISIKPLKGISLYSEQQALVSKALENKRGIVVAPTGSGKTLLIACILNSLCSLYKKKKAIILFSGKLLAKQTYDFVKKYTDLISVGICTGEGFIQGDVMFCTTKSLEKVYDYHEDADILIADEVHEFSSSKSDNLACIEAFANAEYRFGFTATMPEEDIPNLNVIGALGPTIEEKNTQELIAEGKLAKPTIQIVNIERDKTPTDYDYQSIYSQCIVNNQSRNEIIAKIVDAIEVSQSRSYIKSVWNKVF